MHTHGKTRRGIGSIIGGIFLILILMMGFGFYIISNQSVNEFQGVLNDMKKLDVDREQEYIYIKSLSPSASGLSAEIVNSGPNNLNIIYTCYRDISNPTDPYHYTSVDGGLWVEPSTSSYVPIEIPGYSSSGLYSVKLISDRGRSYTTSWPVTGIEGGEDTYVTGEISDIIGKFLPRYLSFQWAERTKTGTNYQVNDFINKWNGNWAIQSGVPIVLRIQVTWYGHNLITLGKNTCFYLFPLDISDNKALYLVNYNESSGTISAYDPTTRPITFVYEQTRTLYFAASRNDITDLVKDGVTTNNNIHPYSTYLNIYDSSPGVYSQSFPLYALYSTTAPRITNTITMQVNPPLAGYVVPSSAQWSVGNNYITAVASNGFAFSSWSSPTGNVVFNYPSEYDTIATYNGILPATIVANFVPSLIDHIVLDGPVSAARNAIISITVTAKYSDGSTFTDYVGKIKFTSSDGQALLPSNYIFTPSDNGIHTFQIILKSTGNQSVTITDTDTALSETINIVVT